MKSFSDISMNVLRMKREKHTRLMFDDVRVDIRQVMEGRKIKHFVINVAMIIDNSLHDVFRVDIAHGYLKKTSESSDFSRRIKYRSRFRCHRSEIHDQSRGLYKERCHLHMQKFWISNEPIRLQDRKKDNYAGDFGYWKDKVEREWKNYIELYQKTRGR